MPRFEPIRRVVRGGLARRLFLLFLLATLVPIALSDWLSSAAVTHIAETSGLDHRAKTTRQVSRQVLDRLLAGKTLLTATQSLEPRRPGADPIGAPPRLGKVFRYLVHEPSTDFGAPTSAEGSCTR
jgi:hypothetical protein